MKTKTQVVIGLAVVVYAIEVTREAVSIQRKNRRLFALANDMVELLENRTHLVNLYAKILNDNQVPMDDFDRIIMNNLAD